MQEMKFTRAQIHRERRTSKKQKVPTNTQKLCDNPFKKCHDDF